MAVERLRRLTVAVDGSPYAERALDFAVDLAKRFGSELTIVTVAPLVPVYVTATEPWIPSEVLESDTDLYRDIVERSVKRAEAAGLSSVTGVALEGIVVDELIGHVERYPTDLLVLGSRGLSSARRLLLGSVSDGVLHHVKCPVLIVRGEGATGPP